jgi:hypothetical protein
MSRPYDRNIELYSALLRWWERESVIELDITKFSLVGTTGVIEFVITKCHLKIL